MLELGWGKLGGEHTEAMMSSEAESVSWCHSNVILSPPLTSTVLAVAALLVLQVMDADVTSVIGLLLGGERM